MPSMCVAFGCDNNGSHQFPQDEVNRRKLRSALKREGFKPSPRSVICKDHFLSTDNGTKSFGSGAPLKRVLKRVTPLWAFSTVKAEKDPKVVERANSLLQGATTKPTMGSNKLKRQCLTYQKRPDGDQLMSTFVHDEATNSSGDTQLFSTSPTDTVANEEDTYAFDTVYMVDGNNVEEVEVLEVDSCNTGTMNVKTELLQNSCKKTFKNIPKRKTSIRKRIGPRKKRRNERAKYYNSISGQTSPPITTVDNESTNSQSPELTLP